MQEKESIFIKITRKIKKIFSKPLRWLKRTFYVGKGEELSVSESPKRQLVRSFFSKKSIVAALSTLIGLFLFVFIMPAFFPLDINYTDPLQQNVAPTYSLRSVPKELKKSVRDINGFSDFTVGVSGTGELYVWGNTKNKVSGVNLKAFPSETEEGVLFAAAGKDHILAFTKGGKLVGWGDKSCGQYGTEPVLNALPMPKELLEIDPSSVKSLSCGYQVSALVTKEGKGYVWGNKNAVPNLADFSALFERSDTEKIVFTNSAAIVLKKDGSVSTGEEEIFLSCVGLKKGRGSSLNAYLYGSKVREIVASNKCVALLTEENDLVVSGAFENGEDKLPVLKEGEYFLSLAAGARHFVGVTNQGKVYAWGHNAYKQCNFKKGSGAKVYAGALQSYLVDGEGKLTESAGLKGYIMGTDGRGRDVFARIVHGGKMTMTIGAVAVLISTAIGVTVGCISGYFGGKTDTLLMRITEIFSAIPFLPFAMLLSQIIKQYNLSETMRIFIIMVILGALSWTGLARMIRGQVLAEREKEFVTAARAMGVREGKIAFKHVLPNVVSVILVSMTLDFAGCLLTESSLSYLGFGVQQPRPTWGNMLNGCNNSTVIQHYWWQWLFPALFLSLAVVCINVLGDGMRDALDPKTQKR